MALINLRREIRKIATSERAKVNQWFFKTGKGQYGEGDIFIGLTVPDSRKIAKKYQDLNFSEIKELLNSKIHEERLIALLLLVHLYGTNKKLRKKIFDFYLKHTKRVNNWDLVDLSCPKIIGEWLKDKDRKILYKLAKSENLWEKRISIVSTYSFIKKKEFKDTLKISEILMKDDHDLIHKAVGWMLREVGKKNEKVLCKFLNKYSKIMPRTMLRYSIERLDKSKKEHYMRL